MNMSINDLPNELILMVLEKADVFSVPFCCLVSRKFHHLVSHCKNSFYHYRSVYSSVSRFTFAEKNNILVKVAANSNICKEICAVNSLETLKYAVSKGYKLKNKCMTQMGYHFDCDIAEYLLENLDGESHLADMFAGIYKYGDIQMLHRLLPKIRKTTTIFSDLSEEVNHPDNHTRVTYIDVEYLLNCFAGYNITDDYKLCEYLFDITPSNIIENIKHKKLIGVKFGFSTVDQYHYFKDMGFQLDTDRIIESSIMNENYSIFSYFYKRGEVGEEFIDVSIENDQLHFFRKLHLKYPRKSDTERYLKIAIDNYAEDCLGYILNDIYDGTNAQLNEDFYHTIFNNAFSEGAKLFHKHNIQNCPENVYDSLTDRWRCGDHSDNDNTFLSFVNEHIRPFDPSVIFAAIANDLEDTIEFLLDNNCPCDRYCFIAAIMSDNLDTVKMLHERRIYFRYPNYDESIAQEMKTTYMYQYYAIYDTLVSSERDLSMVYYAQVAKTEEIYNFLVDEGYGEYGKVRSNDECVVS